MKKTYFLLIVLLIIILDMGEAAEHGGIKPMVKLPWEGDTHISGFGVECSGIRVSVNGIPFHKRTGEVVVDAEGNFCVELKEALKKGQVVRVEQVPVDREGGITYIEVAGYGLDEPLYEGQWEINAYLEKGLKDEDISVFINGHEKKKEEVEKNYNRTTGKLQVHLGDELKTGQRVQIESKKKKYKAVKVKEAPLQIKQPVLETAKMIEGFVNSAYEVPVVDIKIYNSSCISPVELIDIRKNVPVFNGTFAIILEKPLAEGNLVKAVAFVNDREMVSPAVKVKSAVLDWGRIRSYFTFGAIMAKNKSEFSQIDPYLDFHMNTHWQSLRKDRRIGIITYVGARLTSKPRVQENEEITPQNNEMNVNFAGEETKVTITSNRAAIFHGGIFFPIYLTEWHYQGNNVLFLAPIAKYGFHTFSNHAASGEPDLLPADNFYIFGSIGLRMGHFEVFNDDRNIAPRLISYFDATLGWSEDIGELRETTDPKFSQDPFRNLLNLYIEGRLRIPKTPFITGVEMFYPIGCLREMRGDIRFTVGTRINVHSTIRRLLTKK
jgi:hypothetical protein